MRKLWLLIGVLLVCVASALGASHMTYNATQYRNATGVFTEGQLNSTYWVDADLLNSSEVAGAPGFDVRFNFTGMAATSEGYIQFNFNVQYDGNPAHVVYFQFYNYSNDGWNTLTTIPEGDFNDYSLLVLANDTKQGGIIMTRFYHTSPGNTNHHFSINYLSAMETEEAPPPELEYQDTVCPLNSIQSTMLYIFIGIVIVGLAVFASYTSILFFSIIVAAVGMMYAFPLWGCNPLYGLVIVLGFIFYALYEAFWKYNE